MSRITEAELTQHIEKSCETFKKICQACDRGLLTKDDRNRRLSGELHRSYNLFLNENDLSQEDKDRLARAFHIPKAFFEPPDPDCPIPDWRAFPSGRQDQYCTIRFHCGEGIKRIGEGHAQIGESMVLIDRYGLKAEFEVLGPLSENRRVGRPSAGVRAKGTIEGYTSARPREIEVAVYDGIPQISLITLISEDDRRAFDSHPLWDGFRKYQEARDRMMEQILEEIIAQAGS